MIESTCKGLGCAGAEVGGLQYPNNLTVPHVKVPSRIFSPTVEVFVTASRVKEMA